MAAPYPTRGTTPEPRRKGRGLAAVAVAGLLVMGAALHPADPLGRIKRAFVGVEPRNPGTFAFIHMQPGSPTPVGYDPCQVIEVAVNPSGAPEGYGEMVDTVIAHVVEASGLTIRRVADTKDRDRWSVRPVERRPVLIIFASPHERPRLEGTTAGYAGSLWVRDGNRRREYLTGQITLDSELFATSDRAKAQAIIAHELGHVLGLDHVADPGELMYEAVTGNRALGPGDRAGLARLGALPCSTPTATPTP